VDSGQTRGFGVHGRLGTPGFTHVTSRSDQDCSIDAAWSGDVAAPVERSVQRTARPAART